MTQKICSNNILVVAAHPDDEVLGCAGTMAAHVRRGDRVAVLLMTDGVTSRTYDPLKPAARPAELKANKKAIERRAVEARRAASVLGVKKQDVHLMNLKDQRLDTYALLDIIKRIEGVKGDFAPGVVYTHFWQDLNLDHQIVCKAVLTAFRPNTSVATADVLHFEVPESTWLSVPKRAAAFKPNHYVDIEKTLDVKLQALMAYASEQRAYPDRRSPEFIKELARKRGKEAGLKYAEGFVRL